MFSKNSYDPWIPKDFSISKMLIEIKKYQRKNKRHN